MSHDDDDDGLDDDDQEDDQEDDQVDEVLDDDGVLDALAELGVDIVAPNGSKREEALARSLERFSQFVLEDERELCLGILDVHLEKDDGSVGELQGGSDAHRIYRAVLPDDDDGDGDENENENDGGGGGDGGDGGGGDDGANDGEVQYNPVLLHLDLCCILFGHLDFAPRKFDDVDADADAAAARAKRFLLDRLVEAVRGAPDAEAYERQLGDDRADVRTWLSKLARSVDDAAAVEMLLADATASESLLFAPDVAKKRKKRKYRRRKGRG
jgi:hypothetical protein